ncbi:hypothetical protein [Streptomyces sp. NPDC010273]|uniref:hypothetical protein n=1 Tax=Streptomyces sp. NPDC010273 TaxID=3364829 RepID=UPI0036F13D28
MDEHDGAPVVQGPPQFVLAARADVDALVVGEQGDPVGPQLTISGVKLKIRFLRVNAVAQELDLSPTDHHLTLRHLRLSPAKARELGEALAKLVDDTEEDAEDEPVHGVLVALYQQAPPTAPPTGPASGVVGAAGG